MSVGVSLNLRHWAAANRVLHVAGCPAGTASLPSGLDFVAPFPNLEKIRRQAWARQIERSRACSRSDSCGPLGSTPLGSPRGDAYMLPSPEREDPPGQVASGDVIASRGQWLAVDPDGARVDMTPGRARGRCETGFDD